MRLLLYISLVFISACQQPRLYENGFLTFGTIVELSLYADSPEQARLAFEQTEQTLEIMHRDWHAWKAGPLTEVNQALRSGQSLQAGHRLLPLIERARLLSIQSGDLFNPAIGQLIAAWGFHQDDIQASPPPGPTIAALLDANPTMQDLQHEEGLMLSINPALQLDFGGFAKGYGLGIIAEKLKSAGIRDFILNAGGDLVAHGQHPDRPWRIAIRDPDGNSAVAALQTRGNEAVFTSGDYERYYVSDNKRRHHIIDPRTGYPAEGTRAVTVIHTDPGLADAAATALFIAGPDAWPRTASDMAVTEVLLLDSNHVIHMTPSMAERVQLSQAEGYEVRVIPVSPSTN